MEYLIAFGVGLALGWYAKCRAHRKAINELVELGWHWKEKWFLAVAEGQPAPHSTLSFEGGGKVKVDVNELLKSPKVQEQIAAVRALECPKCGFGSGPCSRGGCPQWTMPVPPSGNCKA